MAFSDQGVSSRLGHEQHIVVAASSALSARVASVLSMGTLAGSTVRAISGHTSIVRLLRRNTRDRPTTKPAGSSLVAGADQRRRCAGADRAAARG